MPAGEQPQKIIGDRVGADASPAPGGIRGHVSGRTGCLESERMVPPEFATAEWDGTKVMCARRGARTAIRFVLGACGPSRSDFSRSKAAAASVVVAAYVATGPGTVRLDEDLGRHCGRRRPRAPGMLTRATHEAVPVSLGALCADSGSGTPLRRRDRACRADRSRR